MSRRWRNPTVRARQRRSDPPWVVAPVSAPDLVPGLPRRRRPLAAPSRGGHFQLVPSATTTATPGRQQRRRTSPVVARRGRFQPVMPSVVAAAGPGPLPAELVGQGARRSLPVRRGRFLVLVPEPPPPPVPAPLVPALQRRHRSRLLPVYRGRVVRFPLVGLEPVALGWPPRAGSVTVTGVATSAVSVTGVATALVSVT